MKIVYKASNILEAHIVAGMFNAHGIATHVGGHFLQGAIGNLSMFDFANVSVAENDIDQALSLIHLYENSPTDKTVSTET